MMRYVTEVQPDGTTLSYFKSVPLTRTHFVQTIVILIVLLLTAVGGGAAVALAEPTPRVAVPIGNPEMYFDPDSKFGIHCEDGSKVKVITDGASTLYGYCQPVP